jgi:hypothetical protein
LYKYCIVLFQQKQKKFQYVQQRLQAVPSQACHVEDQVHQANNVIETSEIDVAGLEGSTSLHDIHSVDNVEMPYVTTEDVDFHVDEIDIAEQLVIWYLQYNISKNALTGLLKILSKRINVPQCASTLLKNISKAEKVDSNYSYYHFGIHNSIQTRLSAGMDHNVPKGSVYKGLHSKACEKTRQLVTLSCNIDGLRLFNSASKTMWPILCKVNESRNQSPFVASLYIGCAKPTSLTDFLVPFILEFKDLQVEYHKQSIDLHILFIVCDAPARSLLKGTKSHGGYDACDYCKERGQYSHVHKKVIYLGTDSELRTDTCFQNFQEDGHQLIDSPFTSLLPMISSFPPEFMHLVNLGVMRRLLFIWLKEVKGQYRLTFQKQNVLSSSITALSSQLPIEFTRRCRGIDDFGHWKAVEFRCFLLYIGPVVLKDILPQDQYRHFLLLHFAIYSLASTEWEDFLPSAALCLKRFVEGVSSIYGEGNLVYNVHVLCHLSDFVKMYGPLDFWSAFWGESYLGLLRSHFRGRRFLLSQAVNRVHEIHSLPWVTSSREVSTGKSTKDRIFLTTRGIACMCPDSTQSLPKCYLLTKIDNLYDYPVSSQCHHIGVYTMQSDSFVTATQLKKCVAFEQEVGTYIVFPMCSASYYGN